MATSLIIDTRDIDDLNACIRTMLELGPVSVQLKSSTKRSLSQNAISWVWYGEISKWLLSKCDQYSYATPQWCHDAMCHTFLGYEEVVMIDVVTKERTTTSRLKGTSGLDVGEFKMYLDLVYNWALSKGLLLTIPDNSEYMKLCNLESGIDG
jgi:hypothetical protein